MGSDEKIGLNPPLAGGELAPPVPQRQPADPPRLGEGLSIQDPASRLPAEQS